MERPSNDNIILFFIFLYIVFFGILSFLRGNSEFVYYSIVFLIAFLILHAMHKRVRFPVLLLAVIAGFGIFHFIGGLFTYKGTLIYEIHIFKFGYDNFIHLVASFLYTIIGYSLLEPGLNDNIKKNRFYFGFLLFIFGFGIAAFGEIVELIGVLQVGSPGVGDYFNNAFDLVFNAIGALVASLLVVRHHWKKDLIKVRQSS